jgi:hypothetical protein
LRMQRLPQQRWAAHPTMAQLRRCRACMHADGAALLRGLTGDAATLRLRCASGVRTCRRARCAATSATFMRACAGGMAVCGTLRCCPAERRSGGAADPGRQRASGLWVEGARGRAGNLRLSDGRGTAAARRKRPFRCAVSIGALRIPDAAREGNSCERSAQAPQQRTAGRRGAGSGLPAQRGGGGTAGSICSCAGGRRRPAQSGRCTTRPTGTGHTQGCSAEW